jgi:hypothetical protein
MKHASGPKPRVAQTRLNMKAITGTTLRKSQPGRRNSLSGSAGPQQGNSQNAERNYQRYLALARNEALAGDPIAAENYFQHAEHYFRSMAKNKTLVSS